MLLKFDFNNMMADYIGEQGIKQEELDAMKAKAADAVAKFNANRGQGWLGWSELPYNQDEIVADILDYAKKMQSKIEYFVVLGIGGSALGPAAVFTALCHFRHNDLPKDKQKCLCRQYGVGCWPFIRSRFPLARSMEAIRQLR